LSSLVSIIVPCFNAERWLRAAIESALSQLWSPTEVIVVDDGSTDRSLEIARRFESRGVKILSQANRGASAARNAGLAAARGKFIQFLDADDLLDLKKIEAQMQRLSAAGPNFIASASWARFTDDPKMAVFETEPNQRDLSGVEFLLLHYSAGWMMQPAAWLTPRTLLDKIGPWDEQLSLNDDGEYFARVMLAADGILFCQGSRCFYRSNVEGSLSTRRDEVALKSLFQSTSLTLERLLPQVTNEHDRSIVADAWLTLAFECYPWLPQLAQVAEDRARAVNGKANLRNVPPRVRRLARFVGWRAARRAQLLFRGQSRRGISDNLWL
jgi:glycosyltransferase involved in cell wall biosynthesis